MTILASVDPGTGGWGLYEPDVSPWWRNILDAYHRHHRDVRIVARPMQRSEQSAAFATLAALSWDWLRPRERPPCEALASRDPGRP